MSHVFRNALKLYRQGMFSLDFTTFGFFDGWPMGRGVARPPATTPGGNVSGEGRFSSLRSGRLWTAREEAVEEAVAGGSGGCGGSSAVSLKACGEGELLDPATTDM